jgi:hypothetical protein
VADAARAVATRLADQHGPGLAAEVEAALYARETERRPERYFDPISLGTLIVGVASLVWTIYNDLRKKTPDPPPDVVQRAVRVELRTRGEKPADQITDIVITEIIRAAGDGKEPTRLA